MDNDAPQNIYLLWKMFFKNTQPDNITPIMCY